MTPPMTWSRDPESELDTGYALYARTSTERQRDQETIVSQLSALRQDCAQKHRRIVAEFIDDGVSGSFLDRPGLNALREAAKQGQIQSVLCWDLDRLGRAEIIEMLALRKELTNLSVPLIEARSGRDLAANDQYSELLFILDAWKANAERLQILERTSRGKRRAVAEGRFGGGVVPYGYSIENKRLVIDREEEHVVRLIYEWCLDGASATETAIRLNARAVPPKMTKTGQAERRRVTPSGLWSQAQITSILRNKTYAGTLLWGRRTKKGYSGGEPITVACPAIVTPEQWLAAREAVQSRRRFKCARDDLKYPLRGLIRCGVCGRTYVGLTQKTYRYYRCSAVSHPELRGGRCKARSIRADWLEDQIWAQIAALLAHPENVRRYMQGLKDASGPADPDRLESIAIAEHSLQKQSDQLVRELGTEDSNFIRQGIRRRLGEIESQLHAIDEERDALLSQVELRRGEEKRAETAVAVLRSLGVHAADPTREQRVKVMQSLVSRIDVDEGLLTRQMRVCLRLDNATNHTSEDTPGVEVALSHVGSGANARGPAETSARADG